MKAPRYDRMRRIYSLYTNDELDCAAKEFDGLTGEARNALQYELRQRGLESQDTSAKPIQAAERLALDSEQPRTSGSNWLWPVVTNEEEAKKAVPRVRWTTLRIPHYLRAGPAQSICQQRAG